MNMHPRSLWSSQPLAQTRMHAVGSGPNDIKSEGDLLDRLQQTYGDFERLNRAIRLADQCRRYLRDPHAVARAAREETEGVVRLSRLMDRMRALEGQLGQVRARLRRPA
jgi:hypothetical protein